MDVAAEFEVVCLTFQYCASGREFGASPTQFAGVCGHPSYPTRPISHGLIADSVDGVSGLSYGCEPSEFNIRSAVIVSGQNAFWNIPQEK